MNEIKFTSDLDFLNRLSDIGDCERPMTPEEIATETKQRLELEEKEKSENLQKCGIGKRYWNLKLTDYACPTPEHVNVFNKVVDFIKNHYAKTLWMLGNAGTGKTMLAAMICRECFGSHYCKSYQIEVELDDCKSFKAKESKTDIIKRYTEYPVLVIDEVGRFNGKEELKYLYIILNERYEQQKTTVLISNFEKTEFAEYLGKQLYDRFTENCNSIEFKFDSYRINKRGE